MKVLLLVGLVMAVVQADDQILKEFSEGNIPLTADIYKQMVDTNPDNFAVCLLSVETVLALLLVGAADNTAKQLSTGLHLPESNDKIQEVFAKLTATLKSDDDSIIFNTANKVYLQNGIEINDEFKNTAVNVFGSEIQNIDFSNAEQAATKINKWVEHNTMYMIKNLISPNGLNDDTRLVLVNALLFAGVWEKPFSLSHTTKKPFYVTRQDQIDVDMMAQTNNFNYYENPEWGAKFLEMKYTDTDYSMTFILPNDTVGLPNLEEAFLLDILATPKFSTEQVNVQIPKFLVDSTIEFKPILKALGIVEPFEGNANFAGISNQSITISDVIQKTFIFVDEFGTIAASATAATGVGSSAPVPQPKEFIADHPFIFIIKYLDIVLFIGRNKHVVH